MSIYYWAPFISKVATIKAVLNSAISFKKYTRHHVSIIDSFGEWKPFKKVISKKKINLIFSNRINITKLISSNGYIKSRISYILIFIFNFLPLLKILRNQRPDFLIVHLITSLPLFLFLLFNFKTKLILRLSGLPKLNIIRKFLWFIVARKCFAITAPTTATYNNLRKSKIFNNKKIFLLRDPILDDTENINFKKKIVHKYKRYILSVGRLTKQKNHEFLIRCFFHIVKIHKDINLLIIGDGELKEKLEKIISELNLQKSVFLLGYKKNIKEYIYNSLCVVSTSLWEDPGFVMIEAASLKKIIISSDCPNGPKEFLEGGEAGYLFKSNNHNEFIKTFNKFIYDNNAIKNLKLNKAYLNSKDYTIINHYNNFYKILKY